MYAPPLDGPALLARLGAAALLWGPILLWLDVAAAGGTSWVHLVTATALALIAAQALSALFRIPVASGARSHRVEPSRPHQPLLVAGAGLAAMAWGAWSLVSDRGDLLALAALPSGFLALWIAQTWRADPIWSTWIEVKGEALRVHCPRAQDWTVPLSRVVAVHLRPTDGSFLVEAPEPEHDVFVPSRSARARFHVTDSASLFEQLSARVQVNPTDTLLLATRRRGP